ncbi:MAG: M12 family metallo-peptidase [Dokdonella sp.]
MRFLFIFAFLFSFGPALAAPPAALAPSQVQQLAALKVGDNLVIGGFPDGYGGTTNLRFERIDIYAPNARVIVIDAAGEHDVPRSSRSHLIGSNASGDVRASLSYDAGFTHASGVGSNPSGAFAVSASSDASGITLRTPPSDATLPAGVVPEIISGDDAIPSGRPMPNALALKLISATQATTTASPALHLATIAVDTDNELMSTRFSNNTTSATNWIADLFTAMNVMFQRDLAVTLQQGTTYLRTTTDPYASSSTAAADSAQLNEFGNYWAAHYGSVPRAFAMLLSGKSTSQNSASGIGWINGYCSAQYGYSVSRVYLNANINVSYSALIVSHELGHNFGAYHTHCTNVATGAQSATTTIDQCNNSESGCYNGPTSCPASGPGAPAGTIMSYCNLIGCGGGQNVLQFHPTQIATLSALVAQNTPTCLAVGSTDLIFANGFD